MRKQFLALAMVSMIVLLSASATSLTGDTRQDAEAGPEFTFTRYNTYAEVKAELERLEENNPDIVDLIILGQTWEGRDIMALRLTDNPQEEEADEPDVLIMGGHHAKELPSVEVPMYILRFLAGNYSTNNTVKELVDSRDIWFVPLVNPDGREYVLNTGADWRKNRRPIDTDGDGTTDGIGVDLNRNYGHLWGELPGTSHDVSDHDYCGPSAFSENETQAIRDLANSQDFVISLSYHTYGQVIYYPWNNNIDTVSPRGGLLAEIARDLGERTGYTPMQGVDAYPTTGDSDDWLYSEGYLPFTIEMGTEFQPPVDQLEEMSRNNLDAALHAIELAREPERALLPEWTFMVYMSADADISLANEALVDLNEMEVVGSTQDMNIIVLHDGKDLGDSRILHIQKDAGGFNSNIISPEVDDQGAVIDPAGNEADMSDPELLGRFTQWVIENYPAQKYMLDIWGHGNGVLKGFVEDRGSFMYLDEVSQALDGLRLDIVGFDACSMGHMEMAKELVGISDILIGSEALEPLAGWDYSVTLQNLAADSAMGPRELAALVVDDFLETSTENWKTLAALDVNVFDNTLLPALDEFSAVSMDFAYEDHRVIWEARNNSDTFRTEQDAVDLYEFLGNLVNISGPVSERRDSLLAIEEELIIRSGSGSAYPDADTMAVYFPMMGNAVPQEYLEIDFADNLWDEYLAEINDPTKIPDITRISDFTRANSTDHYDIVAEMGGGSLDLIYRVDGRGWTTLGMTQANGTHTAQLPGQANSSFVEYYFIAPEYNITDPYEVKWGAPEYFNFTVNASCDPAVLEFTASPQNNTEGNITVFRANYTNFGPDIALANVGLIVDNGRNGSIIGWEEVQIQPGEYVYMEWNWTAEAGHWNATALIESREFLDTEPGNNEMTIELTIEPPETAGGGGIGLLHVLLVLLAVGSIPLLYFAWHIRKTRGKRRNMVENRILAARSFLEMAQEFGGDVSQANIMLVKAEVALERGNFRESEGLIRKSREIAMLAVAEKGEE